MTGRYIAALLFLLMSFLVTNSVNAAENPSEFDAAFVEAAFDSYSIESVFPVLLNRGIPVQTVIAQARGRGYSDDVVADVLYLSGLSLETVVVEAMNSHLSPEHVLRRLDMNGVDPQFVLRLLIQNDMSMNRILVTCKYMLGQGITPEELVHALSEAGADRATVIKVGNRFGIPPATMMQVYRESMADFGQFGHVYTRDSLPQPALIAIGVTRIHISDTFGGRVISPSRP